MLTAPLFAALVGLTSAVAITKRQTCTGQSCQIAAIAGSSKESFTGNTLPKDSNQSGGCCIIHYNPSIQPVLERLEAGETAYCAANPYVKSGLNARSVEVETGLAVRDEFEWSLEKRQTQCSAKILMWAKGTIEPGDLGLFVGPAVQSQLNSVAAGQWSVQAIVYDASFDGDYCLGLPGAIERGIPTVTAAMNACPQSKFFIGGYSQGAMVARNTMAYNAGIASKIHGVLNYGDPFNGASIKNYNGPIITTCDPMDGVCSGELNIGVQHLAYGGNVATSVSQLNALP